MEYDFIDLETFPRRKHFEYFSFLQFPYVGTTADVDITQLRSVQQRNGYPFFLTMLYAAGKAIAAVPELMMRIKDEKIIMLRGVETSHTIALDDGTYCYCTIRHGTGIGEFIERGKEDVEKAITSPSLDDEDPISLVFISSLPWLSYTSLVQPVPLSPPDSNPRITWGRFRTEGDRTIIPVSILVNHALVDGIHIARFYSELEKAIADLR